MKQYNSLLEDVTYEKYEEQIKRYRRIGLITFVILVIALTAMLSIFYNKHNCPVQSIDTTALSEKKIEQHIGEAILYPSEDINDSILYNYLNEINAWYPDILLAQAKIESASYTSTVFKKASNLYGMKQVNSRFHCQTSSYNSYGGYDSWKLSVLDRVLWDLFIFDSIKPQRDEYLRVLRNYAESRDYINIIQKTIKQNSISHAEETNETSY